MTPFCGQQVTQRDVDRHHNSDSDSPEGLDRSQFTHGASVLGPQSAVRAVGRWYRFARMRIFRHLIYLRERPGRLCLHSVFLLVSALAVLVPAPASLAEDPVAEKAPDPMESEEAAEDDAAEDEWAEDDWDDWDDDLDTVPSGYPDPLEPVNRAFMSFNNAVDRMVLDPVTQLYRFLLPDFSRAAIVRLFDNVNSPQVMVNDSLQLEWNDAAITTSRLLVNSTLGIGGLMDPAKRFGLDPHVSDFGQTLTLAGVKPGLYLVLPLLGPSNVRDGIGMGVDSFLHPTFYVLGGTDLLIFGGSAGLTARARHFEEIKALKESSVDIYSALRSGYYQNRESEIWSRRDHRRPAVPN